MAKVKCKSCKGSGMGQGMSDCRVCKGQGVVEKAQPPSGAAQATTPLAQATLPFYITRDTPLAEMTKDELLVELFDARRTLAALQHALGSLSEDENQRYVRRLVFWRFKQQLGEVGSV